MGLGTASVSEAAAAGATLSTTGVHGSERRVPRLRRVRGSRLRGGEGCGAESASVGARGSCNWHRRLNAGWLPLDTALVATASGVLFGWRGRGWGRALRRYASAVAAAEAHGAAWSLLLKSVCAWPKAMSSAAGDPDDKDAECGGAQPFFAQLGGEALDFYTPQNMLEALLHHRGSHTHVAAVARREAGGKGGDRRDAVRPAEAAAPPLALDDPLPPDLSLGGKGLPPGQRATALGQDFSVGTLVGHLQDAIMVGLCLTHEEFRTSASTAAFMQPVFGGLGVFYALETDVFVVWASRKDDKDGCYCSSGGADLTENVGARVRMGLSSTCSHAVAYVLALRAVSLNLLCASVTDLLRRRPALDGSGTCPDDVRVAPVHDGQSYVVAHNRIVCVVSNPPPSAKGRRPVCRHVPCRSRNIICLHSLAVKPSAAGYGDFDSNPDGDGDAEGAGLGDGDDGGADAASGDKRLGGGDEDRMAGPQDGDAIGQERRGKAPDNPGPAPRGPRNKKGGPRSFADTDRVRRARNMLPCKAETARCARYDEMARGQTPPMEGDIKLFEDCCIKCGHAAEGFHGGKPATLHTLSWRLSVVTYEGVCSNKKSCGMPVPFDGSRLGLFCYSTNTVYTRTFLDIILFTIISNKSSISAASAVSAFQLHCTGEIFDGDSAKSRQELGGATDEYSRTLIIPRNLYRCSTCYGCSETPYAAVVADGQTIGIFRDASYPFDRPTQNVPTIPISIDNACSVSSAKVTKCIRQRLKAGFGEEVVYSKADQQAMAKFVGGSRTVPPLGDHADASHRALTATWAATCFWSSFFVLSATAKDPGGEASLPVSEAPASPLSGGHLSSLPAPLSPASSPPCPGNGGEPPPLQGGGPARGAARALLPHEQYKYCNTIAAAIGGDYLLPIVKRERWSVLYTFFRAFLSEPVIGVFAGTPVDGIEALAGALIDGKPSVEWLPLSHCVQSNLVIWPVLDLLAVEMDQDREMCRAIGEVIMFSLHTDLHMESLWRAEMNADALEYEAEWKDTSPAKYRAWLEKQQTCPGRLPSGLVAGAPSQHRARAQADEVRSGIAFPDLEQVRPHPSDAVASEAARKAREKARTNPKKSSKRKLAEMEDGGLGDDDCRHAFLTHSTFTPGVVSYLCSCGILLGFEVLESAESPAGIVAALTARFPRLPRTIYFDTACQSARNATRRVPWLVRISQTAWALDRFHALAHKCSPLFDANNYPKRSGMHKTSAAENRHSLNKPLKKHLTYLGQDRFVVQMRLIGAINNLLILYRRSIGRSDVRHRPLPLYFHTFVASVCEVEGCECRPTQ